MTDIYPTFVECLLDELLKDKQKLAENEKKLFELSKGLFKVQEDNYRQMNTMMEYQKEIQILKAKLKSSK